MGNGVHISQKSKVRRHKQKNDQEIMLIGGRYLHDFVIALTFSIHDEKKTRQIDFLPLFQKHVKGDNLKYFAPGNFKKFKIKNNNIYWGKNEDVIFSSSTLLDLSLTSATEEILYVI